MVDLLRPLESSNDMPPPKITSGTESIPARVRKLGYASYRDYLKSEHWQSFRKKFFASIKARQMREKYGGLRCEFCEASGILHLHHRTYKRLGKEWLGDVVLICENCHNLVHSKARQPKVTLWRATKKIRRYVTKKTKRKAKKKKETDAGLTRTSHGKARKRAYQRASEIREDLDTEFYWVTRGI
jgi:5-methylcytosine-specific restriction endonuclease McrA